MRLAPLAAVVVAALMAGCFSGGDELPDVDDAQTEAIAAAPLPENISAEETVVGSTPLSALLSTGACGSLASGTCYRYEVTLDAPARMTAMLSWNTPANDFDLLLAEDGERKQASETLPPGTEESLTASLQAGTYELLVVAYLVTMDTFELDVVFTST